MQHCHFPAGKQNTRASDTFCKFQYNERGCQSCISIAMNFFIHTRTKKEEIQYHKVWKIKLFGWRLKYCLADSLGNSFIETLGWIRSWVATENGHQRPQHKEQAFDSDFKWSIQVIRLNVGRVSGGTGNIEFLNTRKKWKHRKVECWYTGEQCQWLKLMMFNKSYLHLYFYSVLCIMLYRQHFQPLPDLSLPVMLI